MASAHRFFATTHSRAPLILRLTVGRVLLPRGSRKRLGLFGGDGYSSTLAAVKQYLRVSPFLTTLVIIGEFFESLAMTLWFSTRFVAVSFILIMTGAIVLVHWENGFFLVRETGGGRLRVSSARDRHEPESTGKWRRSLFPRSLDLGKNRTDLSGP